MNETLLYKLINTNLVSIRLNEQLPKFTLIKELLGHNNLAFDTWNPNGGLSIEKIEMTFTADCKFQDIYLFAYLMKDFGLAVVYPSRKTNTEISFGTYLHQFDYIANYAVAEGISIDDFLRIDPKLETRDVIEFYFPNKLEEAIEGGDSDEDDDYDDNEGDHSSLDDYNEGPRAYGYDSWDDMAFNEAFEGDIDAWNHYNQ